MKTKIKKTLQLDNKWIKIMLVTSVIAIVGLSFYPENGFRTQKAAESISMQEMQDLSTEDSLLIMMESRERNTQKLSAPLRTPASVMTDSTFIGESIPQASAPESAIPEPIVIQIVKEKESFDWKAMISWIIGGMNGMVLLMMNIKNLKKK